MSLLLKKKCCCGSASPWAVITIAPGQSVSFAGLLDQLASCGLHTAPLNPWDGTMLLVSTSPTEIIYTSPDYVTSGQTAIGSGLGRPLRVTATFWLNYNSATLTIETLISAPSGSRDSLAWLGYASPYTITDTTFTRAFGCVPENYQKLRL